MANPVLLVNATVTGANTATRITAGESSPTTRIAANTVCIHAVNTNAASVFIGDSSVESSTRTGIELTPGSSLWFPVAAAPNALNLADIYFASTSASASVSCMYVVV